MSAIRTPEGASNITGLTELEVVALNAFANAVTTGWFTEAVEEMGLKPTRCQLLRGPMREVRGFEVELGQWVSSSSAT